MARTAVLMVACGVLLTARAPAARAGNEERPAVKRVDLYVQNGQLTGDVTSTGLFSEQIVGTVQSGLPAVFELFYALTESGKGPVLEGVRAFSLKYDVWDDVYSVTARDSTTRLPSFEALRAIVEHMKGVTLAPADRMLPNHLYFLQMSVAVNPLQGTDKRRVAGWVRENVRSGRESPWHEQLLNLNELIAHFFSKDSDSARRSEWFRSALFRPELLPSHDGEGR